MVLFMIVIYGLLFGSFFNVLICRLPQNRSLFFPPSHCPSCKSPVKPWQNIPIISYLLLRGKCSSCKHPISLQYPLVEACTALAAATIWLLTLQNGFTPSLTSVATLAAGGIFLLLLIPMSVIDFRHYIIPDSMTLPFIIIGAGVSFFPVALTPQDSFFGILAGGGMLYAVGWIGGVVLKKEAMGGGDIKLMAAAGALFGPQNALLAIIFGAFLGALYGITIMAARRLSGTHQIPFGPFLGCGIWIAVFAGQDLLNAYLQLVQFSPGR